MTPEQLYTAEAESSVPTLNQGFSYRESISKANENLNNDDDEDYEDD